MKRASIRVQEPTPELIEKIRRARVAISQQKPRYLKCPYCQHNAIAVYEDTRGHVESKCKKCGRITVFDVLNMRRELYQMMFPEYPDIVTVKELREMLGISRKLAYKLIDYGYIHAVKIGTTLKIPKISVINYVMEKEMKKVG